MRAQFIIASDTLSSDLRRKLDAVKSKRPIHQAMGMAINAIAKRSFNDPGLRASPWKAKVDGTPATLRKSGTLAKSLRVGSATESGVTVGSDRHYAAIHQLGGNTPPHVIRPKTKKALKTPYGVFKKVNHPGSKIPARPFFPFDRSGRPTANALEAIGRVVRIKVEGR